MTRAREPRRYAGRAPAITGTLVLFIGCQSVLGIEDYTRKAALTDAGRGCLLPSDCEGSEVCLFRECSTPCQADEDCPSSYRCLATTGGDACVTGAQAACETDGDCPAGSSCADGECRNPCGVGGAQCLEGQSCVDGFCVQPRPDAGGGGSGGRGGSGGGGAAGSGGGTAGSSASGGAAGADASAGGADAGPGGTGGVDGGGPVCDPAERPVDSLGVFVAPGGDDVTNNGSRQAPFATVAKAIQTAKSGALGFVYLAPGAYLETLVLEDLGAGITVRGGWILESGTTRWLRDCDALARQDTLISAPTGAPRSTPTVELRGGLGQTRFESLTIRTKLLPLAAAPGTDGDTQVGLLVNDSATGSLHLIDVAVVAAAGGDGGPGQTAAPGQLACQGVVDCTDGATGESGVNGETPDRGTYTSSGFRAARGGRATPGAFGNNGTPPGAAATLNCVWCYTLPACTPVGQGQLTAQGTCGCGGYAGKEGSPGGGGGASIAVYVGSDTVTVDIDGSQLEAAGGGVGAGPGGTTVPGGGSSGAADSETCPVTCVSGCINYYGVANSAAGGTGGPGGTAGTSGSGGVGTSHALVVVSNPSVTVTDTSLSALDQARLDAPACGNGSPDPGEACDDGNRIDSDACSNACTINCGGSDTLNPIDGTCLRVHTSPSTWDMARAACQHIGTGWDLMVFDSAQALASTLTATSAAAASYWVGYYLPGAGLSWTGVDGSTLPSGSPPWAPGAPPLDGPCAEVAPSNQLLNDVVCGLARPSICGRTAQNYQQPACQAGDGGDCG